MHFSGFPIVSLLALCLARSTQGLNCYECTNAPDVDTPAGKSCSDVVSKGMVTSCSSQTSVCVKIVGSSDGSGVEIRRCGEANWSSLLGGTNKCLDAAEINNFQFTSSDSTTSSSEDVKTDLTITSDTISVAKTTTSKSRTGTSTSSSSRQSTLSNPVVCVCDSDKCDPAPPKKEVFKCWQCADVPGAADSSKCAHVLKEGKATECGSKFCMKSSGTLNGEQVESRMCAAALFAEIVGGKDKCIQAKDIPEKYRGESTLKDGTLCVCDTSECNPATLPRPAHAFVALAAATGLVLGNMGQQG